MIVDDDPDTTLFFKLTLEENGFYVDAYNDPLEALSKFNPGTYDLLLIDIRMPRLNGFKLFRRIKKKDNKVKVCFVTSFETYYRALKEEHPTLNSTCFMRKPISASRLLAQVKSQLSIQDI